MNTLSASRQTGSFKCDYSCGHVTATNRAEFLNFRYLKSHQTTAEESELSVPSSQNLVTKQDFTVFEAELVSPTGSSQVCLTLVLLWGLYFK